MKKIFALILLGILVGSLFAIYMFSNAKKSVANVIAEDSTVFAFQVGVYTIYDNALKAKKKYSSSYIYKDENNYRVFIAIYQDREIINALKDYYTSNNTNFYLKQINVNQKFLKELNKYEKLLIETGNIDTYLSANNNILKLFGDTL